TRSRRCSASAPSRGSRASPFSPRECTVNDRGQDAHACPLVHHIVVLEAFGWHVIGLRTHRIGDEPALWCAVIERHDESAMMTMTDADPGVALAELVRYAKADAA